MSRSRKSRSSRFLSRLTGGGKSRRTTKRRSRKTGLTNIDFKGRVNSAQWQRLAAPVIALLLAIGLGLTTLRTDIVRMEYDLASAGSEEQTLIERQRRLTVEHRNLLDPGRLRRIARERGFVFPDRVIDLESGRGIEVAAQVTRP